jgi:hypothetical protein
MTISRFYASIGRKRGQNDARADMNAVIRNYRRLVEHLQDVSPDVLYEALEPAFELSQEYCPVSTGTMRASGYLEKTTFRGIPTVEIGYGRGGVPEYTVAVHENLEWKHDDPTRAKWLQVALSESAHDIQDRIRQGYRQAGGF